MPIFGDRAAPCLLPRRARHGLETTSRAAAPRTLPLRFAVRAHLLTSILLRRACAHLPLPLHQLKAACLCAFAWRHACALLLLLFPKHHASFNGAALTTTSFMPLLFLEIGAACSCSAAAWRLRHVALRFSAAAKTWWRGGASAVLFVAYVDSLLGRDLSPP